MMLGFKDEFVPEIKACLKTQTIRKKRKRPIKRDDELILATGVRTKNFHWIFRERSRCIGVERVDILSPTEVVVYESIGAPTRLNDYESLIQFAWDDGFNDIKGFMDFFKAYHGPFPITDLQLIRWRPPFEAYTNAIIQHSAKELYDPYASDLLAAWQKNVHVTEFKEWLLEQIPF